MSQLHNSDITYNSYNTHKPSACMVPQKNGRIYETGAYIYQIICIGFMLFCFLLLTLVGDGVLVFENKEMSSQLLSTDVGMPQTYQEYTEDELLSE